MEAHVNATPQFSTADESTWPVILNAEQVAAIYQRTVCAVKRACQLGRFIPAPYQKQPYRWRKADVMRQVNGGHMQVLGRRRA